MKADERKRKKNSGELVTKKNAKLAALKNKYSDEMVGMTEMMHDILGQMSESRKVVKDAKKQTAHATKDALRRLEKMRESVDKMNEMKDALADGVSICEYGYNIVLVSLF